MGKCHAGKILVSHCLRSKCVSEFFGSGKNQPDCFLKPDCIRIVQHVHAGGTEVDYSATDLALLCIGLDLSHQVMMDCGLDLQGALYVHILRMCLKICKLCVRDKASLVLDFGQGNPHTPQNKALVTLRPYLLHF